jgi:hypothetical protein
MRSITTSETHNATCALLSCTSAQFDAIYADDAQSTELLIEDARKIVSELTPELQSGSPSLCALDKLVLAMLDHSPHSDGARYAAASLILARQQGNYLVTRLASAWWTNLFSPSPFLSTLLFSLNCSHPLQC